jgi:large exoprotein involved in heme utilization and adhesion
LVDASSDLGIDGIVEIHAPDVDLAGSLAALPESALDASDQLAERCSARRRGETEGSFTVAGAGLRPGPEGWLPAWSPSETAPFASPSLAGSRCR